MKTGRWVSRSMISPTYASVAMSAAGTTSTFWTVSPLMLIPMILLACSFASAGVAASLTPPALPRPPVWTWAFTTTARPSFRAMASASSGVAATPPSNIGTPAFIKRSRAWYSCRFTLPPPG